MKAWTVRTNGALAILPLLILLSCGALANGTRVTVVNEVLQPVDGAESTVELYLSRLGTYYAELYLERDGAAAPSPAPVEFGLGFTFLRGEEVLLERELMARFEAGQPVTTLFFVDIPRDLPQREALAMVVTLRAVDPALRDIAANLRLQLSRKPQLSPLHR